MIDLFETARQLQAFCDRHHWPSCFIGGIAVQRWGEPPLAEVKHDAEILRTLARLRWL